MSFDSYHLKYIALITMFIDHFAVVFRALFSYQEYMLLRYIGRIAFPIFCFLLAEGFFHTRDRRRYLIRLLIFAVLSEIPYDLALKGGFTWEHQNVFITLALGFIAMMLFEQYQSDPMAIMIIGFAFSLIADGIHVDYGSMGVLTILFFYFYKKRGNLPLFLCLLPLMALSIHSHAQFACIVSLFFLYHYNGEKGRGSKYLFYIAYPAHLLLYMGLHTLFL